MAPESLQKSSVETNGVEATTDEMIGSIEDLRDPLAVKGVEITITGLTAQEKLEMKAAGLQQKNLTLNTQTESVQALADAASEGNILAVQAGSRSENVIDPKGAQAQARAAGAEVDFQGVTETDHNGSVTATLQGKRLERMVNAAVASGTDHVVLDLSRTRETPKDAAVPQEKLAA